ncbi:probable serine/threonine-protein kinase At1g54610 [Diospyros lotus]|uniref:probable serine/threonine-protein kinase At1g54610 n=1 Tax=Diospyros lotus TaxID=55363 RepID=UPI002254F2CF|nr:probable serine/threonine-protein kinase At1g54610 [Diospyros lotus]
MGSAQAKLSISSPPPLPRGKAKLKMENGYGAKEKNNIIAARRSTGQRVSRQDSGGLVAGPETGSNNSNSSRQSGSTGGSSRGSKGGQEEKIVITRKEKVAASLKLMEEEELVNGWPKWLTDNIPKEALVGLIPRSAECYDKIDKVGEGTYSNVYKARDRESGKIVALKKVRFDTSEPESVKFMAREIMILQKLDHPNIVKLEGLATSRMQYSLYLVFDYMQSDLARVISRPGERLTEPQVKCYMHQLLSGLQHCHERGILHRDIKGSNLLIDKSGMLKIADFGLANYFDPRRKQRLTSRVVTLWYRAPELLLGATEYGVGIDLWSAGCLMAEMFAGRPLMPGRTEVEQIHKIFKLCGTPSEEYWKKLKASKTFRPPNVYKSSFREVFQDFPASSLGLLKSLLALDPAYRGTAASALRNEFFSSSPLRCDLSGLPVIYKEDDEPTQTNQRRRRRSFKVRQRLQTQRERQKEDLAVEKPIGDSISTKEELEKITESNIQLGSSGPSSSSSLQQAQQEEIACPLLSPDVTSRKKISPSSESHPNAKKNIKSRPPLPNAKTRTLRSKDGEGNVYRLSQVQRSISTRDFRRLDQREFIKLQATND